MFKNNLHKLLNYEKSPVSIIILGTFWGRKQNSQPLYSVALSERIVHVYHYYLSRNAPKIVLPLDKPITISQKTTLFL